MGNTHRLEKEVIDKEEKSQNKKSSDNKEKKNKQNRKILDLNIDKNHNQQEQQNISTRVDSFEEAPKN